MRRGYRVIFSAAVVLFSWTLSVGCKSDDDNHADESASEGGAGGAPENRFPCESPEPVLDESTGYVSCANGVTVRSVEAECPSELPRDEPVADYQFGVDECEKDGHCTRFPNGFCRRSAKNEPATCGYGCTTDEDCKSPMICACGDPVGLCVPAACTSDENCLPGFHCASNSACDGRFECQHEDDACATDDDCDEGRCVIQQQRRVCATEVRCTQ